MLFFSLFLILCRLPWAHSQVESKNTSTSTSTLKLFRGDSFLVLQDNQDKKGMYVELLQPNPLGGAAKQGPRMWISEKDAPKLSFYEYNRQYGQLSPAMRVTGPQSKADIGHAHAEIDGKRDEEHYQSMSQATKNAIEQKRPMPLESIIPITSGCSAGADSKEVKVRLPYACVPEKNTQPPPRYIELPPSQMSNASQVCGDRRTPIKLPPIIWREISEALKDPRFSRHRHILTPAFVASMLHLESSFNPLLEMATEKKCGSGGCAQALSEMQSARARGQAVDCATNSACATCNPNNPYKWGKGPGQVGASEDKIYGIQWDAGDFEARAKQSLQNCVGRGEFNFDRSECQTKINDLVKDCRKYAENHNGQEPALCFRASARMLALKALRYLGSDSVAWVEKKDASGNVQVVAEKTAGRLSPVEEQRFRAGAVNRVGRVPLALQCLLNKQLGKSLSYQAMLLCEGDQSLPNSEYGGRVLNKQSINRCHVWNLAGLCGPVAKNSLLQRYQDLHASLQTPNGAGVGSANGRAARTKQ